MSWNQLTNNGFLMASITNDSLNVPQSSVKICLIPFAVTSIFGMMSKLSSILYIWYDLFYHQTLANSIHIGTATIPHINILCKETGPQYSEPHNICWQYFQFPYIIFTSVSVYMNGRTSNEVIKHWRVTFASKVLLVYMKGFFEVHHNGLA